MKKGQGSLEYLLILAAILAIAVVVVVVANTLLSTPQAEAKLGEDRYACSLVGIELVQYAQVGVVTKVNYGGTVCAEGTAGSLAAQCTLGDASVLNVTTTAAGACEWAK